MDNFLAIGLVILLLLRGIPLLLRLLAPRLARRLLGQMLRFGALLDIAGGTLMGGLVIALVWQRAWIPAVLLAAISIPTFLGLIAGFRLLARNQTSDVRRH